MKAERRLRHSVAAIPVMLGDKEVVLMTKFLYLLSAVAIAAVLSACTVVLSIGAKVDETVSASTHTDATLTSATPKDSLVLGPDESIVYRVNVDSTALDALYLYLDADLDLYVYRDSESLYATSASADFFARGRNGLDAAAVGGSALAPSDVGAALTCPGSCVILPSGASDPVYVRVANTSSSDVGVSFYAVLRDFQDSAEASSALQPLPLGTTTGALETLNDIDAYEVQGGGSLSFDGTLASGIAYEAEITDPFSPGSSPRYLRSGDTESVLDGEEVRVYGLDDRAAVSGKSQYFLDLQ